VAYDGSPLVIAEGLVVPAANRYSCSKSPGALSAKPLAFIVPIVLSAYLTAAAVGSPTHAWVGWLSLLPVFFAIRLLRPLRALICGAVWGASLYVFCVAGGRTGVPATASSFVLLAGIPALYTYAASALTRWIGFSPFVLGVGWMGVELALAPLGLHSGLLSGSQDQTVLMDYIGRALGYVLVGFLVAYVNALLVEVFGRACLRLPRPFLIKRSGNGILFLRSQIDGCLTLVTLQPSNPRAPPM
jgi:apolipoprotein N-acyltransferase